MAGPLSDLHESISRERAVSRAGDGSAHTSAWAGRTTVRVVRERGLSAANVRELRAMEDHLLRGGLVGFSRDHAKTWAGYCAGPTIRGASYYPTMGNAFAAWSASGTLASGDEVVAESAQPEGIHEIGVASSINSSGDVLTSGTILYTRTTATMVRWRDFYPALRLADEQSGRPILTTEHRIAWTLDITLELCPEIIAAGTSGLGSGLAGLALADDAAPAGGGLTLDAVLGRSPPMSPAEYTAPVPPWSGSRGRGTPGRY
jgi:hypothetical protein